MATSNTPKKKYNSVATLAFTVYHDDPDDATDAEYQLALIERMAELVSNNEWQDACDITDTQPTPPDVDPRCNMCGLYFGDEGCYWPSRKNESFGAITNEHGHIVSMCCEYCQQEIVDEREEGS